MRFSSFLVQILPAVALLGGCAQKAVPTDAGKAAVPTTRTVSQFVAAGALAHG